MFLTIAHLLGIWKTKKTWVICDVETYGWIQKWLDNVVIKVELLSYLWNGGYCEKSSCMILSMWTSEGMYVYFGYGLDGIFHFEPNIGRVICVNEIMSKL
jgi:hypothetical protein